MDGKTTNTTLPTSDGEQRKFTFPTYFYIIDKLIRDRQTDRHGHGTTTIITSYAGHTDDEGTLGEAM